MTNSNQDTKTMLSEYSSQLQSALQDGLNYTKLLNQLVDSKSKNGLLSAAEKLTDYHLDNSFVKYPKQFSAEDYYLIFMNRLFEQNGAGQLIQIEDNGDGLQQQLSSLGTQVSFSFSINHDQNGGAFYYANLYDQPLFYINLTTKDLDFNGRALTRLFLIDLFEQADINAIQHAINVLRQFGEFLIRDYHFSVNLNILENHDDHFYHFDDHSLSKSVLDQLFIVAARNNYMLKSYQVVGAELSLDNRVKLEIYPKDKAWGLQVIDGHDTYSWLELMLKHDFLRQWYLNNIDSLAISTNQLIFS